MECPPNQVNTLDKPPKFMYRPPGRDEYINIADAFDELYNRIKELETQLQHEDKDEE